MFARILGVGACALALAAPARANLITNGSFETPATPAGSFTQFTSPSAGITGWTVGGADVLLINTTYTENGGNVRFTAQDGSNSVDLTGAGNTGPNTLSQVVATQAGQTYALSFFVGATGSSGNAPYAGAAEVDVLIDGNLIGTFTNGNLPGVGNPTNWEGFTTQFTAATGSTTVTFRSASLPADNPRTNFAGLDNVSMQPVPEPASLAALGLGVAGVAGYARRRLRTA